MMFKRPFDADNPQALEMRAASNSVPLTLNEIANAIDKGYTLAPADHPIRAQYQDLRVIHGKLRCIRIIVEMDRIPVEQK